MQLINNEYSQMFHLSDMFLSAEFFISCSILQLSFFSISTTYQRKYGFVFLNNQIYSIGALILSLSTILVLNEDLLIIPFYGGNNTIVNDYLSFSAKLIICLTSVLFILIIKISNKDEISNHNFEYMTFILISILGSLLICSSNDLLTAYLSIELQSVAFYLMAAFKKNSGYSIESGLKYFIIGSLSSAFFLFGSSILYGCFGSLNFDDIRMFYSILTLPPTLEEDPINCIIEYLGAKYIGAYGYEISFFILINSFTIFFVPSDSPDYGDAILIMLKNYLTYDKNESSLDLFSWAVANKNHNYFESNLLNLPELQEISESTFTGLPQIIDKCDFFNLYEPTSLMFSYYYPKDSSLNNVFNDGCPFSYYDGFVPDFSAFISKQCEIPAFYKFLENFHNLSFSNSSELLRNIEFHTKFCSEETIHQVTNTTVNLNLIQIGFMLICISLFIKLALAPFHFWSLDVYEGSPNSTTAFFAIVPKIGLFVLLIRICYFSLFDCFLSNWQSYFFAIAVLSIFVGSVGGLEQRKLKTLLAYSSVSHTGYLLLAFSSGSSEGITMMLYYLSIFMLSGLCFWSVFLFLKPKKTQYCRKNNKELGDLVLLRESNPMLAFILAITLFSIAGIPPIIGFLAKIGVFLVALSSSAYLISVISILFSVISTFYYIRIIKILYFENTLVGKLYLPISTNKSLIISLLAIMLIILCINPSILYLFFTKAVLLSLL